MIPVGFVASLSNLKNLSKPEKKNENMVPEELLWVGFVASPCNLQYLSWPKNTYGQISSVNESGKQNEHERHT
jgi:hypothetical protein